VVAFFTVLIPTIQPSLSFFAFVSIPPCVNPVSWEHSSHIMNEPCCCCCSILQSSSPYQAEPGAEKPASKEERASWYRKRGRKRDREEPAGIERERERMRERERERRRQREGEREIERERDRRGEPVGIERGRFSSLPSGGGSNKLAPNKTTRSRLWFLK
jgi:hypothetical protein